MSTEPLEKSFLLAVRGKILFAFTLSGLAIALALVITYFSFQGLLDTVDQLASPNEKLKELHKFFQNVAQLDQQQRAEAITNPSRRYSDFMKESQTLFGTLDTLRKMDWRNGDQQKRLTAMKDILERRDKLFLSYLKFRSGFMVNKKFSEKLDSLSSILSNTKIWTDSNVTTTQRRTVTTTFLPQEQSKAKEKNLISRIFRKKEKPSDAKIEVREELSIKIDTLLVAQRDSAMVAVDHVMKSLGQNQQRQNKNMLQHELDLINANTILINQLLTILHETEEEELALVRINNDEAVVLVNKSMERIGIILTVFFIGGALLIFLILTDIARSNFYRLQLVKAKEEAEQLTRVKQRFLANMSHEIRTPLQSIVGYSEQLKKTDAVNGAALQAIHSSSEHLLHIVNEILDYSRIESGKFTLERQPFSIGVVVRDVSMIMRVQAENRGLSFRLGSLKEEDATVMGDAFRLRQILFNVLGNAVKFTEQGSISFDIDINSSENRVHSRFTISDTGIGMDAADIDRVFQQFEQADASITRRYGGTGLGLTIVKTLVESQQGTLSIESEPNKGTRVTINLSFDRASDTTAEIATEKLLPANNFKGKVLIVDDDPLILTLCLTILEKHGIPYLSFQDSTKVLETNLQNGDITLALLDVRMPGINGLDLCRQLRKKLTNVRFIALTAHVLPQEKADLLNDCFDDVLTKPFREQTLLELLNMRSPVPVADATAILDFPAIRKMTMGDETLYRAIVKQFLDETADDVANLDIHIKNLAADPIREIVHRLAGRTGQFELHAIAATLKTLEGELSKGKELLPLCNEIQNVREEIIRVLQHVQADLAVV